MHGSPFSCLLSFFQNIADALAEGREKEASRLIVAWNPGCLKSLPQKVPTSLQPLSVREVVPLQIFGEKDSALHGRKVLLRGGVYMKDRVGANDLQEDSTRSIVNGRHLALWLFARALGLHARLGLTLTGCMANCRDRLRLRFFEGPSMRAAYYGALNTDILRISNVSAGFIFPHAAELCKTLSTSLWVACLYISHKSTPV